MTTDGSTTPEPDVPETTRRRWPIILLAGVAGYGLNLFHLAYPFGLDHFTIGWIGRRLLAGELPYVHHADHAFPGGMLLYAVAAAFSPDPVAYRVFDWAWQLGAGVLLFAVCARLGGTFCAFAAMLAYGTLYGLADAYIAGNRDPMVTLLYLGAIFALASGRSDGRAIDGRAFAGGVLSATIVLIKPTHGLWCLLVLGWLIWQWRRARPAITYVIGCAVPILICLMPYLSGDRLTALYECTIAYNLAYSDFDASLIPMPNYAYLAYVALLGGVACAIAVPKSRRPAAVLGLMWLCSALAGCAVQRRFFPNHLLPAQAAVIAWLIVGAFVLWGLAAKRLSALARAAPLGVPLSKADVAGIVGRAIFIVGRTPPKLAIGVLAVAAVAASLWIRVEAGQASHWKAVVRDAAGRADHEELISHFCGTVPLESTRAARFVTERSSPSDRVVVFRDGSAMAYLSDRRPPSRFFMPRFVFPYDPADQRPMWKRWQREFSSAVVSAKPLFVVFRRNDLMGSKEVLAAVRETFPEIWSLLQDEYSLVETIGAYEIHERRSTPGEAG